MTGTVLITGGTGFVGRQVLQALKESEVPIRLVVRDTKQDWPELRAAEQIAVTADMFSESSAWWANVCSGVETVVHVAWNVEFGKYLQSAKNLDCLAGTLELAKGATAAGCKRFVGIGTCFEYDLSAGDLSVHTPLRPTTLYAAAKAAAFLTLSHWLPMQGISFAWCRLFYLFGEGEDERRFVPYLRAQLAIGKPAELTNGTQVRDYLDVREAGRIIAQIVQGTMEGPINVCSGIPITVRQLAEKIADEYGRRDLLRFGVRQDNLVDPPRVVGIVNRS